MKVYWGPHPALRDAVRREFGRRLKWPATDATVIKVALPRL